MALITLDAWQIRPAVALPSNVTEVTIRFWYSQSFLDSSGQLVASGTPTSGNQIRATCTVSAGVISVPATSIYSTLDAQTDFAQGIQFNCQIFRGNTALPIYPFNQLSTPSAWFVPNVGSVISFEDLALLNQNSFLAFPQQTYPTTQEMINYVNSLVPTPLATNLVYGRSKLSVAAANPLIPIAVGDNDPRLDSASVSNKGISYASVAPLIAGHPTFLGVNDPRVLSNIINVKGAPYYAAGDGSIDDTAALVAAAAAADLAGGGTLFFPDGTFNFTGLPLGASSSQHYINVVGAGLIPVRLNYTGSSSGQALLLKNEKYPFLKNFTLVNAGSLGTSEGVRASGTSAGTNTNGLVVDSVLISGFHYGWRTSDGGGKTSSEITFLNFWLNGNDNGFYNDDFNGLNFNFINLQMSSNTIGLYALTAGLFVYGGSAAGNSTDFKYEGDGTNVISGYRSESVGTRFIDFRSQGGSNNLVVVGCQATMASSPNTSTAISAAGGKIMIEGCNIGGQIAVESGNDVKSLVLRNNGIVDPNNTFTSIANPALMGPGFRITDGGSGGQFESLGNVQYDTNFATQVGAWPNGLGVFAQDEVGATRSIITSGNCRGSDIASDANVFVRGLFFHVTGTTTITNIPTSSLPIGMKITLVFDGVTTLTDGGNLKLAGNFVTSANDSITLLNDDGTNWIELGRSVN